MSFGRGHEPPTLRTIEPGTQDDHALVAAAQGGDRAALDALLRVHHDRIAVLCRRMAGNEADGADATQEALIAIVRGLPRFDGRSRFGTWAYRVATNACLDELRRRRRRPEPTLDAVPGGIDSGRGFHGGGDHEVDGDVWEDGGYGPAGVAGRLDVDAALRRLPADFRAAVVLRDLCGLDYAEIAEVLGVPAGTVRSRISRGRAALLPLLSTDNAPPDEGPGRSPAGGPGNRGAGSRRPTDRP